MADCCVGAPVFHAGPPSSFLSDPCVCNADLGTVYVNTINRDIYIRTLTSVICAGGDWELIGAGGGGGDASTMPINLAAFPASCTGVVVNATVQGAIIDLACAIRNPPLNIMSFSTTGIGCVPTVTIPTNLQALLNFLICRDETILAKQLPWRINGQTVATVNSGATVSNWITHFGNVSIGLAQGILANAKLEVAGSIATGDVTTHTLNSVNNNAIIGGASAIIYSSANNSVVIGGTSNKIGGVNSVTLGGASNLVDGGTASIVSGAGNEIHFAEASAILSGESNTINKGAAAVPLIISNVILTGTANLLRDESNNSVILGGQDNELISSEKAMVGVGLTNTINGGSDNSVILGGTLNTLNAINSIIAAGISNTIVNVTSSGSGILSGTTNKIERASYSGILTGNTNIVGGAAAATLGAAIVGGTSNTIEAGHSYSFIGAGTANLIQNNRSGIVAGQGNTVIGQYAAILSGVTNQAGGLRSAVITGLSNTAGGENSVTLSGTLNAATGNNSAILSGDNNAVASTATTSAVVSGSANTIALLSVRSAILSGNANVINPGINAAIVSGLNNTIASGSQLAILTGDDNEINTSVNSAILYGITNVMTNATNALVGGLSCQVLASNNIAFGRQAVAQAAHTGIFIWQSNNAANFNSAANNEFAIKPIGGVRIFTNAGSTTGMTMAAGGSSWVAVSSAKVKQALGEVPTNDLFNRLDAVSVKTFKYKKDRGENAETYDDINIGTTAEEWNDAFGDLITPKMIQNVVTNNDGTTSVEEIPGISQQDQIGVLLLLVKELAKEVQNLKNKKI